MMTRITVATLFLFSSCPALIACLNTYGTDLHGQRIDFNETSTYLVEDLRQVEIDRVRWAELEAKLAKDLDSADFKQRSDYAAALIYLGRHDEAIGILEDVEQNHPGEYIVATNLGTAYELNGDLDRALIWIQKGFERNPDSHQGSEWLHVKILEARLQLEKDPHWLKTHSVLGIDLGRAAAPAVPDRALVDSRGTEHSLENVRYAIEYQLHERLKFVKPQDAVVGDLLFDLGNVLAITSSVEQAVAVYEFAEEYGVQDLSLLQTRKQHFQTLAAGNPHSGVSVSEVGNRYLLYSAASCFGVFLILVVVPAAFLGYRHLARRKGRAIN